MIPVSKEYSVMDKDFLKSLLRELESLYEVLIPLSKTTEVIEPEFIIEIQEHMTYINNFIDETLIPQKDKLTCLCGGKELFDDIIFIRDKIIALIKPLELKSLNKEFTSKMFKTHSTVLFERKLGFLVNKETYDKILSYIKLNKFEPYQPELFNIVVKHPALPYTVKATVKPKDFLNRVLTSRSNYTLFNAPYIYINEEQFKDISIHGIEVMNYSDNWRFLEYFVQHTTMLKSSLVELSSLDSPPMNLIFGNESTITNITEKDMSLHEFIKFVFNKSLDSGNYNKRYYLAKYQEDSYLFRDINQPEEKAILIAKDDKTLDNALTRCRCRHLIRNG